MPQVFSFFCRSVCGFDSLTESGSASDVCRPCRDRKFSKCKGVFQKRTLSSNCACGLSLADHNITSQLHTTKSQRELTKPPAMSEYDFDDVPTNGGADERATQPSVPQGAQGAWDIGTPPPGRQPGDGEKVGTPGDWAVTDIPDSLHMQVGLQDDGPEGQQLGRRGSEDEGKEEERRQQKSMQAEKLLSKVQMRIMTGSSGSDCDTIAELAALLQSERSEKDALLERYKDLELKLDQTVQHVMGVMEGDKRKLREHIDMLEGTLHRVDGDKRALSKALQSEESKTMQLSHQVKEDGLSDTDIIFLIWSQQCIISPATEFMSSKMCVAAACVQTPTRP
jgi:hypothetical protein